MMHLPRVSWIVAAAVLVTARASLAQGPTDDPARIVQALQVQSAALADRWLDSPDLRTRAWGAFLVLRDQQRPLESKLVALVAAHQVREGPIAGADRDAHDAMLAVLDALIQLRGSVAPVTAAALYPEFPAQSIILLSRPELAALQPTADGFLLDLLRNEHTALGARLAEANLLIVHHAAGVAAAIVGALQIDLQVRVVDAASNAPRAGGYGGSCAFGAAGPPKPGWPDVGNYYISTGTLGDAHELARAADPSYVLRSFSGPDPAAPHADFVCDDLRWSHPHGGDNLTERLLAFLAHAPVDAPPVRLQVSETINWQDQPQYASELATIVQRERARLDALLSQLVAAGALTDAERQRERPRIVIGIIDARGAAQGELPQTQEFGDDGIVGTR